MNKAKKLVASVSRQTRSSTFRCSPIPTIAIINSQTQLRRLESLEPNGLRFAGRVFCPELGVKRSSCFKCWNCGFSSEKDAFLFCDSCRSIQPVDDSVDYFIFSLKKERDYAADQSAKVTEACRTLTKRLSRAMYIMKLHGIKVNEEDTITDPTLLMEIMELREAIAEANDSNELNQIRSQVQEKLKQWSDSFVEAFESQKFDETVKCIQKNDLL